MPEYVLTYAENQPEGYPTVLGAERFAELVRERTGGKVVIQVKAGGEYGSESEVLEQMAFGGIDFARVSLAELSDEIPKLNILLLPFLYEDADHMWRILDGQIGLDFLSEFDQAGLVGLSWYDAGARCFYTDTHPIRTPEDRRSGSRIPSWSRTWSRPWVRIRRPFPMAMCATPSRWERSTPLRTTGLPTPC